MDLPEQVQHVLARLDKGEVRVKLDTEDLKGMLREFDRQNDLRLLGIFLAVVALGTVALLHLEGKTTLRLAAEQPWPVVDRLFLAVVWHPVATRT